MQEQVRVYTFDIKADFIYDIRHNLSDSNDNAEAVCIVVTNKTSKTIFINNIYIQPSGHIDLKTLLVIFLMKKKKENISSSGFHSKCFRLWHQRKSKISRDTFKHPNRLSEL